MTNDTLWQTKLIARIHDPAEKALVLLRDPAGHENGTSSALKRLLGLDQLNATIDTDNADALSSVIFKKGIPSDMYRKVQRADWWAAAADRPQWPMQEITVTTKKGEEKTFAVANWAQVRWANQPVFTHPLTGQQFDLGKSGGLADTDITDIKQRSFNHFSELLIKLGAGKDAEIDYRKALMTFWRFGSDLDSTSSDVEDNGKLGLLWGMLPADTRIPDHSIWDHLDLTSAFAGAFAADPNGEVALLTISIGPVQSFIAAARKIEDLWAGSHLLSRLCWETMRPICEAYGPDAVLFPRLRGIPQVDLWLRDQIGLPDDLFASCDWMQKETDANPLFSAALPNRFVAIVPASQAKKIAETAADAVHKWLAKTGEDVVSRLLNEAGFDVESTATPYKQMQEQLQGFPEVNWVAVPFSLIQPRNVKKQNDLDLSGLTAAMAPFFGVVSDQAAGFLDTPAWKMLQKDIVWRDNTTFFLPNPGVLYPAVQDLAERMLAAAKVARTFAQQSQLGWRDSLTGESEWLTTDLSQLALPPGQRKDTLWAKIASSKPAWAKEGEHLGALSAIKRLWPTIFAEEVGKAIKAGGKGEQNQVSRFVVSTHTMALAHQLDQWLENSTGQVSEALRAAVDKPNVEACSLPRRLLKHAGHTSAMKVAKCLPTLLDLDEEGSRKLIEQAFGVILGKESAKLESYYGLIMMDGDKMGAILAGDESTNTAITYRASFHPQVQKGFDEHSSKQPLIQQYGNQRRAVSPNRHLAISGALNDFSQIVAREVIEQEYLGRLIYAGGDDVLAMMPVADLLPAMQRLRDAYSGETQDSANNRASRLTLLNGFALLKRGNRHHLMRMMGQNATASCGAVVAHHQAPLSAVLRELRLAEKRAKTEGGRNAFSVTVIKRSGGALYLTSQWGAPIKLLLDLVGFLQKTTVSRRAVYNTLEWLHDLPDPKDNQMMLSNLLGYQLARQSGGTSEINSETSDLAQRITKLVVRQTDKRLKWLENFLTVAEFMARETRIRGNQ